MDIRKWWSSDDRETYWMETTDRKDIGRNLNAPQRKENGDEYWGYDLLNHVAPGDTVFHYHKPSYSVVATSQIAGSAHDYRVVWAARGTSARRSGVKEHARPGWRVPLANHRALNTPVTLARLRESEAGIRRVFDELRQRHGVPLYGPFEFSDKRPLRPGQPYFSKLPAAVLEAVPELRSTVQSSGTVETRPTHGKAGGAGVHLGTVSRVDERGRGAAQRAGRIGTAYRRPKEQIGVTRADPWSTDPAIIERGLQSHRKTQNALADYLATRAIEPKSPEKRWEPDYDLSWVDGEAQYVAEVKSLTDANEEKQLRLGLGQVLRYRQLLSGYGRKVFAVLALEREPSDPKWIELARDLNVVVAWPGAFAVVLSPSK